MAVPFNPEIRCYVCLSCRCMLFCAAGHPSLELAVRSNAVLAVNHGDVQGSNGAASDQTMVNNKRDMVWIEKCLRGRVDEQWLNSTLPTLPVSCAGVVAGGGMAMLEYWRAMLAFAKTHPTFSCNDQAIHNILVHRERNKLNFTLLSIPTALSFLWHGDGGSGPLEVSRYGSVRVRRKGWVHQPLYLHQFDRHPEVLTHILKLYGADGLSAELKPRPFLKVCICSAILSQYRSAVDESGQSSVTPTRMMSWIMLCR